LEIQVEQIVRNVFSFWCETGINGSDAIAAGFFIITIKFLYEDFEALKVTVLGWYECQAFVFLCFVL
jgi:hypothetical protein